ncbi:hypothetical protein [Actinomadura terrae]|uniref:hypothetical protein n=1 Tax=Actinomadura terrae TaxID=604353 RepID=UPI001FA80367|nr:hypothetical protein [Actinomadura terrae]
MEPVMMSPARLAQTAAAAFEEVMAAQGRPKAIIRHVADTARERAEDALAEQAEVPAADAFCTALNEVSRHVRVLLEEAGYLGGTVTMIRDAAHRLGNQVCGNGDAGHSGFLREARRVVRPER